VTELFGRVRARPDRPYVVVKFAQSLDGRIATAARDSKWISGEPERRVAHSLRALCDAVLVGAGTIVTDDPLLTVRLVPGASPLRVVFDTTLRIPLDARVLNDDARTLVITTERADPRAARALRASHIGVREVKSTPSGVDPGAALRLLRESGVSSLLVEGGSRMITSLLGAEAVDRLIVSVAPKVLGQGVDAVGDLGVLKVSKAVSLVDRSVHLIGEDVVLAWDVAPPVATSTTRPAALLARGWPGRGDRSDGSRAGG
jgi:riboflavin-specific deaminase-like protein